MNEKLILWLLLAVVLALLFILYYVGGLKRHLVEELKKYLTRQQYQLDKERFALKEELSDFVLQTEYEKLKESISLISDNLQMDGISRGNEELSHTNYKIAEIYFKQALFKDPKQVNAWVGLGIANFGLEQYREALDSIRTAITLDQKKPLYNALGQISTIEAEILFKLGRYPEARDILEKEVLNKNPNYSKAKKLLAQCQQFLTAPIPGECG